MSETEKVVLTDEEKSTLKEILEEYRAFVRRITNLRSRLDDDRMARFGAENPGFGFTVMYFAGFGVKLIDALGLLEPPPDGKPDPIDGVALNGAVSLFLSKAGDAPVVISPEYPLQMLFAKIMIIVRSLRLHGARSIPLLVQLAHFVTTELVEAQNTASREFSDMIATAFLEQLRSAGEA